MSQNLATSATLGTKPKRKLRPCLQPKVIRFQTLRLGMGDPSEPFWRAWNG
jgi:hypothetical protein